MEIFEMEKEFDALMKKGQELIEKLKKEQVANTTKTKRWKPKDGERYYIIKEYGRVVDIKWDNVDFDNGCYNFHNCFKTEEEAQKELDRRIAEQELLDLVDWKDGECSEIVYDFRDKEFSIKCLCTETCYSPYRFVSKESAKKAIDTLGTERLKLIFRID